MKRSERTQMYLDLARLSLSIEKNIDDAVDLGRSMISNPESLFIQEAIAMTEKLKKVRYDLYDKEAELLIALCKRDNNAVEIGTLQVLSNGTVVSNE